MNVVIRIYDHIFPYLVCLPLLEYLRARLWHTLPCGADTVDKLLVNWLPSHLYIIILPIVLCSIVSTTIIVIVVII